MDRFLVRIVGLSFRILRNLNIRKAWWKLVEK